MDVHAEQMRSLRELGLSVCAARAYIALLDLGVGEARAVSELARIPTAKVYGTLEQLQERGLAEVSVGKPRKYTPVPMGEFVERQADFAEAKLEDLRAQKPQLEALFPIRGTTEVAARSRMASIVGRRNVMQRFRDACAEAQRDIFITAGPALGGSDGPLSRLLGQARERGVDVRLVASEGAPEDVAIATFDGSAALFLRMAPLQDPRGRDRASAIYTNEPAFVAPLRGLLAMQASNTPDWALGRPLQAWPAPGEAEPADSEAR